MTAWIAPKCLEILLSSRTATSLRASQSFFLGGYWKGELDGALRRRQAGFGAMDGPQVLGGA
ncbi:hypothetical protein ACC720_38065, partial [Rhizobium ruizarguesonis]